MSADLQAPAFTDDNAAREAMEAIMWPDGPVCPHCGSLSKIGKVEGVTARAGLYYCGECKSQFTVTVGTIFERSKVPLSKWWAAVHLLASSKKGISSHQLHRMLGVHYQAAWFMTHRIREAMAGGSFKTPMGGAGKIVEVDETFIGKKVGVEKRRGAAHKNVVLSLVERGRSARSFHVDSTKKEDIIPIVKANINKETHVMTDESNTYSGLDKHFKAHGVVDHSRKEYTYTDRLNGINIGINGAEGFYSVFKRGIKPHRPWRGGRRACSQNH